MLNVKLRYKDLIFLIIFIVLTIIVYFRILLPIEYPIILQLGKYTSTLSNLAYAISLVGNPITTLLFILIFVYIDLTKRHNLSTVTLSFITSVIICSILELIIKELLPIERPIQQVFMTRYSYPSGHVARLTITTYHADKHELIPRTITIILILLIPLLAISRLILQAHYISDVTGGLLLGYIISTFLYQYISHLHREKGI